MSDLDSDARAFRERVIDHLRLVASAEAQLRYEADVPIADVPAELVCGFVDDIYHPKSELMLRTFESDELERLAEFHGRLIVASDAFDRDGAQTVSAILLVPEWRSVMDFAKRLVVGLERG